MTFLRTTRYSLVAALLHLALAGGLVLFASRTEALGARWGLTLWLILVGFVGCTTFGLSLHLLPATVHRLLPRGPWRVVSFILLEGSVVGGAASLAAAADSPVPGWTFTVSAVMLLLAMGSVLGLFGVALARPPHRATPGPEPRPGDGVTVPLFLVSWTSAVAAAGLFALSGAAGGPGFGWWLAAVHLFVLGHVSLLITAVTLRLVPRLVDADAPRPAAVGLGVLGTTGAVLVPTGMLMLSPAHASLLLAFAAPEAAFAALLLGTLLYVRAKARIRRAQFGLHLLSAIFLLVGGGSGLEMVDRANYGPVVAHALVNLLGFVGIAIIVMWFGMVAPFQRISHAWTARMLWIVSAVWLAGIGTLAWVGGFARQAPQWAPAVGGALLLGVAVCWAVGTVPVLFPRVNPLPGLTPEEIRVLRERWGRR